VALVTVVIPALNEAGNIASLVAEVRCAWPGGGPEPEVIVVDNGSTDGTGAAALGTGMARVVHEPRRGYGYACAAGAAAATASAVAIAFLDGDHSFDPAELPRLVGPVLRDEADLVLGSRALGGIAPGAMPPHQRFGNRLVARSMRSLYGLELTDLGPYRAVRAALLAELGMREMTYGWPQEMLVKAARRGARIVEAPVSYRPRRSGRSKVSGTVRGSVLAAVYILGVTLRQAGPLTRRREAASSAVERTVSREDAKTRR
jgi:glycosyltransferase involved in cell wall biosynthesis